MPSFSEGLCQRPISLYGIHKSTAENYCALYLRTFNLKSIILRLPQVYGPSLAGKNAHSIVDRFIRTALKNGEFGVNGYGKDIKDLRYFIVGDGPEKNKLEKLAEELGVKEDVVFAGEVGNDELVDYYNACDVFVLPSIVSEKEFKSEGFGIVFLEANACGKPVVGTKVSGIVDAVAENESGLLVEQRNVGQLAAAIKKILSDKRLAEKLGKKGRERAMEKFSWDAVAENFGVNVLQKIEPGK